MKEQSLSPSDFCGAIIAYYHKGILQTALVTEQIQDSLRLVNQDQSTANLSRNRVILATDTRFELKHESLMDFWEKVRTLKPDLPAIPAEGLSFAGLLKQEDLQEDAAKFALYFSIKSHPEMYYQKHELFFQRSAEEQESYLLLQKTRQQRQEYLQRIAEFMDDAGSALQDSDKLQLITELRDVLQGQKLDDLHKLIRKRSQEPVDLMVQLRAWLGDCLTVADPALDTSGLPIAFYADYPRPELKQNDLPIADHSAFTIDDEDSLDYDDAISLQDTAEGYRLGIHVSNLAQYLDAGQPLFDLARQRVSSLYLSSGVIPMLPPEFSQVQFSMIQDQEKAVLSLYTDFDSELRPGKTQILAQKIRISENISYKALDKDSGKPLFSMLYKMAESLKALRDPEERAESRRYIYNFILQNGMLISKKIDLHSGARQMVEEMMIHYNSSLAQYAKTQRLPLLFRNISRLGSAENDTQLSSAYLDTRAGYHPGIGTEAYLHATSPIRRFVDLVNQMQVQEHISQGQACFSEDALQSMIPDIEQRIQLIRATVQKSERYWMLKYIEQDMLHQPLEGILRATVSGQYRVEVLPWGKQILLSMDSTPPEYFTFAAYKVDWEKMVLRVDLIE
ncbi:MAG: RNB domain-containing ribonuclease [Candidatus Cloacimonadaceae bacterium]|jgi:exoribonuclease-2|nr:ribonuclease catalytic domain-containing protein [Candidatus Cloacimonadota bacterium]MDY0128113.1 RNB domain-containing ribonuclease [Candidatus Cloacimonadaceae bacterium]MCB5254656.1 ribonuclease catalytic domain-containing protein [Candidatus Cloacimonadota bacterium]MCK9179032.1 ribonuclease catalytic domain-containing protein [Candidatus Cloacimonadota bacterium]MCK9243311.1 ribonuclease catalytic domain-containing protein [Candidatus Cloacimonadota bacterium]